MLEVRQGGLYCPAGDFYIDPLLPADRALITHAHGDHARIGSRTYLTAREGEELLRARLGEQAAIQGLPYNERLRIGDVTVSFHPSGHILGSAQIRLERAGEVWVVSGDYKLAHDPTCAPFEPVRCHTFVTESTFGLPIFRWSDPDETLAQIRHWWRENREAGRASILFAYPVGKSQRLLSALDETEGPLVYFEGVERINQVYRASGVPLPYSAQTQDFSQALIVGSANLHGSPWARRFGAGASTAFASGWMRIRGARRRRSLDRGFVMSDHADWPGLQTAIAATGAETIWVTHGYVGPMVRWLTEQGKRAVPVELALPESQAADAEVAE
ncbi:MAG: ligase-associated DNA damage response exonuclease [Candidatus Solibacter sp.]